MLADKLKVGDKVVVHYVTHFVGEKHERLYEDTVLDISARAKNIKVGTKLYDCDGYLKNDTSYDDMYITLYDDAYIEYRRKKDYLSRSSHRIKDIYDNMKTYEQAVAIDDLLTQIENILGEKKEHNK